MRLIDADELLTRKFKNPISYNAFANLVRVQPTIKAEPVRRGRWINERVHNLHNGEQRDARECSECGAIYFVYDMANALDEVPRYCPNCGAKMERVIEDD